MREIKEIRPLFEFLTRTICRNRMQCDMFFFFHEFISVLINNSCWFILVWLRVRPDFNIAKKEIFNLKDSRKDQISWNCFFIFIEWKSNCKEEFL